MMELFPDFLRSVVSGAMFALMLFTLGQPRYEKKLMNVAIAAILIADVATSVFFYQNLNITDLAKFDILFYLAVGIVAKPLFRDTAAQWMFNCITAMNAFAVVTVLSYYAAGFLPFPSYANSAVRLLLFSLLIVLFRRLRPLYRQAVERWQAFVIVVFALSLNIGYYFVTGANITETFDTHVVPLSFMILLAFGVYFCVFYSLHKSAAEYRLREENLNMQNRQDIMHLSMTSMQQHLRLMNEIAQQNNIITHDRRHFNNTLLELLRQNRYAEVVNILEQQPNLAPPIPRRYCENTAVNAAVTYYAGIAKASGVGLDISLDIPEKIKTDALELAIVISNLLENAVQACGKLSGTTDKTICFTAAYTGQLLLEIENPYAGNIRTDEQGHPVSESPGHGVGTRSVLAFAEKQGAQLLYSITSDMFRVRLIL